jgi:6-phosphofructokinase
VDQSSEITDAIEKLDDRDLLSLVGLVQAELKDRVRIYRIMGRLSDKLALAAAIVPRQAAKIEARADAIIAAEADLEKQTDESFSPHETMLDEARAGLDDLKHQLATMSNLPPLSASDA